MKKADIGVALYLLAAVIFLIVPINSTLLDVMLALNISIALIVLFNTLFVKEVLDMSFFRHCCCLLPYSVFLLTCPRHV